MPDRYHEKPFLRLLECYILDAINQISATDRLSLESLAPHLNKTYNISGTWVDVVEQTMNFPRNTKEAIRVFWERQRELTSTGGAEITPQEFAERIVDSHFNSK